MGKAGKKMYRDHIPLVVDSDDDDENKSDDEDNEDYELADVDDDSDDEGYDDDDDAADDDNDVDDEDGAGDDDDYIHPKSFAAKIARQAKYLQQKFGAGDDDMNEEDDGEDEDKKKALWGRNKNLYYNDDNVDYELSDDELRKEEEVEALKIQRENANFLSMEDFGLQDDEHNEMDSSLQDKFFAKISAKKHKIADASDAMPFESFEAVKKDLTALSKEEQMDVLLNSAPELLGLLSELNEACEHIEKNQHIKGKVEDGLNSVEGKLHPLEVKQALLLSYCQAITFYLLLKAEGHPARDHPVIAQLMDIKNMVEKMKEIDKNVKLGMDLHGHAVDGVSDKKYGRATKSESKQPAKGDRQTVEMKATDASKDDQKSSTPRNEVAQVSAKSAEMLKVRAGLEARLKVKGLDNLTRLNREMTPKSKATNRSLETLDDFEDEVQQNSTNADRRPQPSLLVRSKLRKSKLVSGDEDLPKKADIGERRTKHELRALARIGVKSIGDDDNGGDLEDNLPNGDEVMNDVSAEEDSQPKSESEDEFYKEVKRRRTEKLMAKNQIYSAKPSVPMEEDTEADGKRHITYQMEKNRGLTRNRKKDKKIPRKKYRAKHMKAVIRRKGQVRDIRKPSGPYGGEATGINPNVSHSVRFKS